MLPRKRDLAKAIKAAADPDRSETYAEIHNGINGVSFLCARCGKRSWKRTGDWNRAESRGSSHYCSQACSAAVKKKETKALGWHASRFMENPSKAHIKCGVCGKDMWLPESKVSMYKSCGAECVKYERNKAKEKRKRFCSACGKEFYPRTTQIRDGHGLVCSQKCNAAMKPPPSPEVVEKVAATLAAMRARGEIKYLRGEDSPSWKGGKEASNRRRVESGKAAASCRAYRKANPDKVREFSTTRSSRKTGRLPKGTIKKKGDAQRWKCAVCGVGIKRAYHIDHIVPLAKGGEHKSSNIQLLCPTCNVRKSSRDPVDYMQSLGRLL